MSFHKQNCIMFVVITWFYEGKAKIDEGWVIRVWVVPITGFFFILFVNLNMT